MTVVRQLGVYSPRIDRQIAEIVDEEVADAWLRSAIGYHLGWLNERFEPASSPPGGKQLRAMLAVLAYRATAEAAKASAVSAAPESGDIDRVVPFAAAVELLHNWSLVHDDIEDGDRTRRGRPALWTICGEAKAINVGDCIFGLAFRGLRRLGERGVSDLEVAELMSDLAQTAVDLTVGQMRDLTYETTYDVDDERYLEMVEGKTAALMRYATYGGALLGSADRSEAAAFGEFGRRLGLSFQIRDDILGIWGTDADTGKPTGGDIRKRKKTLPIVLGFELAAAGPDHGRLEQLYTQDSPLTPADEQFVRHVLDRWGVQQLAQQRAERHRSEAVAALAETAASTTKTDGRAPTLSPLAALRALADFVTQRTY